MLYACNRLIDACSSPGCRLYYRCAHKDQGCNATRRVQQTQEQPAAYEIAYYGQHTCRGAATGWQHGAAAAPPSVVDFGSNSWGSVDASRGSAAAASTMSQGGSPSAAASEVGFEAQAHEEWHDTAAVEKLMSANPGFYAPDPVMEFLDGSFSWESVLEDRFDSGDLHDIASMFQ